MTATTQWIAGANTNADPGFTASDFNSLASGSTVIAATALNFSNDPYFDVFLTVAAGGTTIAGDYLALYLLPFQVNGTYGDGTASGATPPNASYLIGSCGIRAGIAANGNIAVAFRGMICPYNVTAKLALRNMTSVAFAASAFINPKFSSYRENLNA